MSVRINADLGPLVLDNGSAFFPDRGRDSLRFSENPRRIPLGEGVYTGLVIVGLRGMGGEKYKVDQVVDLVKEIRLDQAGDPGASFISQKGVYRHKKSGEVVDEDSVRVIIMHLTSESREEFVENIMRMGETLLDRFNQESVIVQFQDRGVTVSVQEIVV